MNWLPFLLMACGVDHRNFDGGIVEGLPSVNTHQSYAFERAEGSIWIGATPWTDGGGFFRLDRDSTQVEALYLELEGLTPAFESVLITGPHEQEPVFSRDGRLQTYDPSQRAFVDLCPHPPGPGSLVVDDSGVLLRIGWTVIDVYDPTSDSWSVVDLASGLQAVTVWDGRVIGLTERDVVAVDHTGITPLASCEDDCEGLNWGVFYHPDNGELWIQEHWRWWAFDGERVRSIGPFPNPGAETGTADFIGQVMAAGVYEDRIFTINRQDYSRVSGSLLSWSPGEPAFFDHEVSLSGRFVGSHVTGMVVMPYVAGEPIYWWKDL